jgi:oxalate decarboxylase/phosphoglucose isomerase-like protein (cupin superfamily)
MLGIADTCELPGFQWGFTFREPCGAIVAFPPIMKAGRQRFGYVPFAMGHYVENTGTTPLRFLEIFKSSYYADISLNQWMALTPPELVSAHLKLGPQVMGALHRVKAPVVPV